MKIEYKLVVIHHSRNLSFIFRTLMRRNISSDGRTNRNMVPFLNREDFKHFYRYRHLKYNNPIEVNFNSVLNCPS